MMNSLLRPLQSSSRACHPLAMAEKGEFALELCNSSFLQLMITFNFFIPLQFLVGVAIYAAIPSHRSLVVVLSAPPLPSPLSNHSLPLSLENTTTTASTPPPLPPSLHLHPTAPASNTTTISSASGQAAGASEPVESLLPIMAQKWQSANSLSTPSHQTLLVELVVLVSYVDVSPRSYLSIAPVTEKQS